MVETKEKGLNVKSGEETSLTCVNVFVARVKSRSRMFCYWRTFKGVLNIKPRRELRSTQNTKANLKDLSHLTGI